MFQLNVPENQFSSQTQEGGQCQPHTSCDRGENKACVKNKDTVMCCQPVHLRNIILK